MEAEGRAVVAAAPRAPIDARLARWASAANGHVHRKRLALILVGSYVVFSATYLPINLFSVGREARTLFLPGEERIPFVPLAEYLYVLTYFVPVLLFFTVRDAVTLQRLLRATTQTLMAAYATYLLFPVYFERPSLQVTSLHTWLLSIEYLDKPYNHFPSLHVALTWLAVHASQVPRVTRRWLAVVVIGVSLSTLLVKQHYIVDVIYGFALAWFTWWLAGRRRIR